MGSILVTAKKVQLSNRESEDPYLCEKFSRCCFSLRAKHIFPQLSSHSSIKTVSILNFAFDFLCKDSDQENYSAYSDAVDLYHIVLYHVTRSRLAYTSKSFCGTIDLLALGAFFARPWNEVLAHKNFSMQL